ncbi:hypothetical protein V1L52_12905 [Treponema sp. HNW]|uniref:SpiroCoCo family coiled-coil protein n=1 Tax=Treponema sp. HNW TaxID=3116654 RepID=UPI003D14253A
MIGNIITAAVCFIMLFVFRRLDKKNRSIEKVKKFTDKILADFEEAFKNRAIQAQNAGAELELKQVQAVAAVKKLEQEKARFEKICADFSSYTAQVDNVKTRVLSYEKLIGELLDMTARVEDNLEKIRKHSAFVDKTAKIIGEQQKRLDDTEKRIPALLSEFQKQNAERLGTLGAEYTAALDRRFADLEMLADAAVDKNQQLLEEIQGVFDTALERAREKAESLEDGVFEGLKQNTLKREEEFEALLERSTHDITEYVEREKENLSADLSGKIEDAQREAQNVYDRFRSESRAALQDMHDELNAALEEEKEKLFSDLSVETERISGEVLQQRDELQKALEEQERRISADLAGHSDRVSEAMENHSGRISAELEKSEAELSAALQTAQNALETELQDKKERLDVLIEKTEKVLAEADAGQNEKIHNALQLREERFDAAAREIDEKTQTALDDIRQRVFAELSQQQEELNASLAETKKLLHIIGFGQEEKIRSAMEKQESFVNETVEEHKGRLNDTLSALTAESADMREKVRSETILALDSLKAEIRDFLEEKQRLLADEIARFAEENGSEIERQKAELARFNANFGRAEQMIRELDDTVNKRQKEGIDLLTRLGERIEADSRRLTRDFEKTIGDLRETMEQETGSLADEVQNRQLQINEQLEAVFAELSGRFDTARDEAVQNNARRLQSFFEDTEERIAGTQKDLDYRLKKIESLGADIDKLDRSFRILMEGAEQRISDEFDTFKTNRGEAQNEFERTVTSSYAEMKEVIDNLDSELNELKNRAYDNVSEKLKIFEDDFFRDLNERGENLNTSLEEWKRDFDGRLNDVSRHFENERRNLETQYGEDIKEKFGVLQEKYRQNIETFEALLQKNDEDFQERMEALDASLRGFADSHQERMEEARKAAETLLAAELDRQRKSAAEQAERCEKDIEDRLDQISQSVFLTQEETKGSLEGILGELASWRERLSEQLEEKSAAVTEKLEDLEQRSEDHINQIQKIFGSDVARFANMTKEESAKLSAELESLKEQSKQSLAEYEEYTEEMLGEFKKAYGEMLEDTKRKISDENTDAEQRLRALKSMVKEIQEKTESIHEKAVSAIQNEANKLKMDISGTDRQLKQFLAQTQLIEKTVEMKNHLENQMNDLHMHISRFDGFKQITDSIEAQFGKMRKIDEDISVKLQQFNAGKNKIDAMDANFGRLMQLSSSMDEKIRDLQSTSDDLQILQGEVRRFQDTLGDISGRYDRLEKKNTVLDQTIEGVGRTFEDLRALEERLNECERQTADMPEAVGMLKNDLNALMEKAGRINDIADKLNNLDEILAETDRNIERVDKACEWMSKTEVRLDEMKKETMEQVNLLGSLIKDGGKTKKRSAGAPPIAVRENVLKLKRQGWTVEQIASSLNLTIGEVELILDYFGKQTV